ncbi:MAG: hypothetical protein AB8I08_11775 [Sandaracinaceae bacterium]
MTVAAVFPITRPGIQLECVEASDDRAVRRLLFLDDAGNLSDVREQGVYLSPLF